jgi:hypothetical protein
VIVFEPGPPVLLRRGEIAPWPGTRSRVRVVPYPGEEQAGLDPWRGAYRRAPARPLVQVTCADPGVWRSALASAPPGPIVLGPVPPAEDLYGCAAAAIEACRGLGRGVVAVDWRAESLPVPGPDLVVVRLWNAAEPAPGAAGVGLALPLVPGWTAETGFLRDFFARARAADAAFAVPVELSGDGASRAALHEDLSRQVPSLADAFFDRIHHADWEKETARAAHLFAALAVEAGIPSRAPRPCGTGEFPDNVRAIERLEVAADSSAEPRASALRRAVRRIEELERDLGSLLAEGHGRLIFPTGSPELELLEAALSAGPA